MKSPFNAPIGKLAPAFISRFDSATDMVGSLSSFLKGETFEGVGATPSNELYAKLVNNLPDSWKQKLYTYGGITDATSYEEIARIDAEEIEKWIYNVYPDKKYPAIAIGSSNGAMIHLCAALGIPWLPQTLLIPVHKGSTFPIDKPIITMEWAKEPGDAFLKNNPSWQLHHMMDPSQDRLRVGPIAYFRVKKLALGKWYKKFIEERLEPGGSIIVIDCQQQWPTVKLGDRHYFQFGGMGDIPPEEYYQGSERIRDFLQQQKSEVDCWEAPKPTGSSPESEWGFEPSLLKDLEDFSGTKELTISKITFEYPQEPSPFIADLYRWWYPKVGLPQDRLLVESFTVHAPLLTLQKGSVPYWLFFNVDPAADRLEEYLKSTRQFEEIFMMILSHGKDSLGHTSVERWRSLMEYAKNRHDFVGVDEEKYPKDLAVYARYSPEFRKKIEEDYPLPPSLSLRQLKEFSKIAGNKHKISVEIEEVPQTK